MRILRALLALGVVLPVMACGGSPSSESQPPVPPQAGVSTVPSPSAAGPASKPPTPTPTATRSASPAEGADEVPATLQFTARTVDGEAFDGSTLQGRPVLLWFWAPWCPTCRAQLPEVEKIAATHQDEVAVIGVGSLDSAAAISRFAAETSGFTAQLVDERGSVWKHFEVTEQSSFVLLDAAGEVGFRAGYGGSAELADRVAAVADR